MSVENPRPACLRCQKPLVTCVCSSIPLIDNRTSVWVLQHPRERKHPIGTARFAGLGLRKSHIEVAWNANVRDDQPPDWLPEGAALLYPSEGARDLRELPRAEMPQHLVVLDGTWHTAHTLYRDKRWLHDLPHYRFLPSAPGRYRLRREPQADYVSTIEAVVEALRIIEPETLGLDALLGAFDAMIDRQLALRRAGTGRARRKMRPLIERRTPRVLIENFARLVLVYGEPSRPEHADAREFVYFAAHALGSDAKFTRVMMPETGLPDPTHMLHMGMTANDFDGALSRDEFREAWQQFLRSCGRAPIIAAWNQRTLDLLAKTMGSDASRVSLKSAYRAVFGTDARDLEQVMELRGLTAEPNELHGRAATRMGNLLAVTRFMHARATTPADDAAQ